MRLLIADTLHPLGIEELRHLGVEVIYEPELDSDSLPDALNNVGILVVRSKTVTAKAIEASNQLNLIVRAGHGVGNIDVEAASARGIYVAACKGKNALAVAELTMGLILALDRRIPDAVQGLKAGDWNKAEYAKAEGLQGKRIGILGLGSVGREVLRLARGLGLIPYAWSRGLTPQRAQQLKVTPALSAVDLASKVDILSVHLAAAPQTVGLVSREVIEALPDGAMFLNLARGEIVDYSALKELAKLKKLRIGLDVYDDFPHKPTGSFSPPQFDPGVVWYGTPHIGSQTLQAKRAVAAETVHIVRSFLVEGLVPHAVNVRRAHSARYQIVVRHYDKVGALANTLGVLKRHGINVEELKTNVFDQSSAACSRMNVVTRPTEQCLQEIAAFRDEVIHVQMVALPILA